MVKIINRQVSASIRSRMTNGMNNRLQYICIHETANTTKGANAEVHARLQSNGNSRSASWHYTCGSDGVYQSFPDKAQCWHAGSTYNNNSIGIEIAVNSDGDYKKAVQNAADLTKSLMKKYNIPASRVIQHNTASPWGKDCPHFMRSGAKGITWGKFKKMIGDSSGKASTVSGGSSSGTSYTSVASTWTGQNLKKYHKGGAVKQLQKLVGVKIDGYFGADTEKAVKKAQKKHGLIADGIAGKDTYKALTGKKATKKTSSKANLKVDGKAGTSFVKAIQKATGSKYKDGVFSSQPSNSVTKAFYGGVTFGSKGSPSVGSFQKYIGEKVDNKLGTSTIKTLQKRMGTPVDGEISRPYSNVIAEAQKRLNEGTF